MVSILILVAIVIGGYHAILAWERWEARQWPWPADPSPPPPSAPAPSRVPADDVDDDEADPDDDADDTDPDAQIALADLGPGPWPIPGLARTPSCADPEWAGFPWFDGASCWGCERACKRRAFHPYSGCNIGAELRGAGAARARAAEDLPYHSGYAPHATQRQAGRSCSTDVDQLWGDWATECGRLARRALAGLEPAADPFVAEGEAAADCPF